MAGKLSKEQTKQHNRACELVDTERDLTEEEWKFVLDHFHESANMGRTLDGAFFTPAELAGELHHIETGFVSQDSPAYERFHHETGIKLRPNPGIPTDLFRDQWRDASPAVEIVVHNRDEDELEAQAEQAARAEQEALAARPRRPRAERTGVAPGAAQSAGFGDGGGDTLF
ncbi:hypothetical protein [Streptomyces asoensis]|uniref:hypothetical protein n=1 Tax=Streptomyces asoensis TaxID=249586 RepID=UPI0033E83028